MVTFPEDLLILMFLSPESFVKMKPPRPDDKPVNTLPDESVCYFVLSFLLLTVAVFPITDSGLGAFVSL